MMTFTERLNQALSEAEGVKQIDLARACGVSTASVSAWFSGGTRSLRGANLTRAAALLRVNPLWLAEGRGPKRPDATAVEHALTPPLTPRQEAFLGLLDGLTESQQEEEFQRLQAQKQQNDEMLTELLKRKAG
jgi:transcriptional regulator with XRE-family HTH domain